MNKTNAMRILDSLKIKYSAHEYEVDENDLSGIHLSASAGLDPDRVFKTIVAKGEKLGYLVFCIPCAYELDLKKCARVAGDKRIELLHVKDLLGITGYIRGGCSPIGMKKAFPTFIDETALLWDSINVSAGVRGCQLELNPNDLISAVHANIADLVC